MLLPPKQPYHFQHSAILHPQPNTKNSSPFFPNEVLSTHPPGQPRPSILKVDDSSITGGTLDDIFFYPGFVSICFKHGIFFLKLSGNTFCRGLIILDYHLPGWTDGLMISTKHRGLIVDSAVELSHHAKSEDRSDTWAIVASGISTIFQPCSLKGIEMHKLLSLSQLVCPKKKINKNQSDFFWRLSFGYGTSGYQRSWWRSLKGSLRRQALVYFKVHTTLWCRWLSIINTNGEPQRIPSWYS